MRCFDKKTLKKETIVISKANKAKKLKIEEKNLHISLVFRKLYVIL